MSILFHCQGDDNGRMLQALREALPEHEIKLWPDGSNPEAIKHAVVWMPPENFFDALVNLEHVHAVAAGVDQLLTHKGLPNEVNIYRLEDAGMGVKRRSLGQRNSHRASFEVACRDSWSWRTGWPRCLTTGCQRLLLLLLESQSP